MVVVCLGMDTSLESEETEQGNTYGSGDKSDLMLPGLREEVLKAATRLRRQ